MAVTQYKDIWWAPTEPVDNDKLNTMVNNSRYLFEKAGKLYYTAYKNNMDSGIRISCGVAQIPAKKAAVQYITVPFGTFFSTVCKPVVVVSITSPSHGRVIPTIYGVGGANYQPDNRGFVCRLSETELTAKTNYFDKTMYLNWIAMGF